MYLVLAQRTLPPSSNTRRLATIAMHADAVGMGSQHRLDVPLLIAIPKHLGGRRGRRARIREGEVPHKAVIARAVWRYIFTTICGLSGAKRLHMLLGVTITAADCASLAYAYEQGVDHVKKLGYWKYDPITMRIAIRKLEGASKKPTKKNEIILQKLGFLPRGAQVAMSGDLLALALPTDFWLGELESERPRNVVWTSGQKNG
ncbi:hypothetical protein B0H14DRAFT_3759150 [Mycena olivaceomarginata]|nr:hypothetical protein B0H14DRAFT_3759150 [Mycena olivaceomarginata]